MLWRMTELFVRLVLSRIQELQARVDAADVEAHLLAERIDELRTLLQRWTLLVD